ncbi:hypothetical protein ANCCEY_02755 [Ancylostoma ceylanicum]|uniref:AB hydrolase-1 domain-containing protein n=1 Tax=Ancylostoma ceylanicum TaxID=53326 RepID=A0A0D6M1F7_9BILA|nr:hypothetical protein ANCCEY_02755 [Ancylostoma ceylanicum]
MLPFRKDRLCQLSALVLRKVVRRRHLSTKRVYDAKAGLFSVPVQFRNNKGDLIKLDAVYQDSMPEGGQRATIFAVHGAPGTHADFKYLVSQLRNNNVRMIMPNFPGLGFTPSDPRLCCENEERNEFAQAVLDSVENLGTTDLIFMVYNRIMGLKVPTGDAAAMALRLMRTFGYEKVMPSVDTVNSHPEIKLLHAFSGEDYFIQPDVSRELAVQFENRVDLECTSYDSSEVTRATIEAFSGGAQTVSVNFVNEGHFLQKFRAQYLIDVILSLVSELSPTIEPDIDLSTN